MEVKIIDNCFSHVSYSTLQDSKHFKWLRTNEIKELCVITDSMLYNVDSYKEKIKIAWLIEPRAIRNDIYEFIKNNYNKFDYILTFDDELLNISDKFIFYPFGGCWINKEEQLVHNKNKLISIIASSKNQTIGHILRHEVINTLKQNNYPIDIYGFGYNPVNNKLEALKDYAFSIVIENSKTPYYFTEKLIDSFMTGTVPIYWGCTHIDKFFNKNGMIIFNDVNDLKIKLNDLSLEKYEMMKPEINENFEKAKQFLIAEDWIYNNTKILNKIKNNESN